MTYYRVLRTYRFIDKDPVCDRVKTVDQDEGLEKRLQVVADLAGLNINTVRALLFGGTKSPQNRTIMAIMTSLGYEHSFAKSRKLNVDEELEFARAYNKKEKARIQGLKSSKSRKKKQRRKEKL
jgi:hypothetical protein